MRNFNKTMFVEAVRRAGYDVPSVRAAHYDYAYTQGNVRTDCLRWVDGSGKHHTAYHNDRDGAVITVDNVPVNVPEEIKSTPIGAGTPTGVGHSGNHHENTIILA